MEAAAPTLQDIRAARQRLGDRIAETPLWHWRGDAIEQAAGRTTQVLLKLELFQHAGSFKPRGALCAMLALSPEALRRGVTAVSAGNHAMAVGYAARSLGTTAKVVMPRNANAARVQGCREYGAEVELVAGVITDAGKRVAQYIADNGGFDLSTLKEPYRVEGKKIMGYELLDDLGKLPDAILYPTGGGTGLIGMWKAFDEMQQLGWIGSERPRMFSVQSSGCAPIVRAFDQKLDRAPEWESPHTGAWGLRVPRAIGDRLMLAALRDSDGGAIAVDEDAIEPAAAEMRKREGIDAGPEGGAALVALRELFDRNALSKDETIVVFNTGGNKYR